MQPHREGLPGRVLQVAVMMRHRAVLVVCLGIYAAGALIGFDDYGKVCLSADRVLWHGEGELSSLTSDVISCDPLKPPCTYLSTYLQSTHVRRASVCGLKSAAVSLRPWCAHPTVWRFLTAAVFHMGALHVAFNMLAFVPIGARFLG